MDVLTQFPALRIHPCDRVTGILCYHKSDSGGPFAVLSLSDGRFVATWSGRYVTCATMEDLRSNLNCFERELCENKVGQQERTWPGDL